MKYIKLSQNKVAKVDDSVFEKLNKFKWSAQKHRKTYYALRVSNGKPILMHREIIGANDGELVDHINGDGLDNTKSNLRICTNSENLHNREKSVNNTSGYKGVYFEKSRNKWKAQIMINYKLINIGRFNTKEEAAKAYDNYARIHIGKFTRPNLGKE